jgi:anti-anti-sigma regulatory factor
MHLSAANEGHVLKITAEQSGQSLSLRLDGRVEGPWVEVLRRTWTDAMSHDGAQKVTMDFGGVSFADSKGQQLLRAMQKKGVALTKVSGFMREILERNGSIGNQTGTQDL